MGVRTVSCDGCKVEFSYEYVGGRLRRWCGQGRCVNMPAAPTVFINCACEVCGVAFQVERKSRKSRKYRPVRFCGSACATREYRMRNPLPEAAKAKRREYGARKRAEKVAQMKADGTYKYCAHCGGDMNQSSTYCMEPTCREVAAEAERQRTNAYMRDFLRRYQDEHGHAYSRKYRGRDYNKNYNYRERHPDRAKHYDHVRRARMANCERESFPDSLIFERDEWVCGICSEPVDRSLKYPDPKSASLDHIVPLSKGGGHTMDNVQLAHFGCNCRKHDKLPGELVAAN